MIYQLYRVAGKVACIQKQNQDGSTTSIPLVKENSDYQEFLAWSKSNSIDLSDQPFTPDQESQDRTLALSDIKQLYQQTLDQLNQIASADLAKVTPAQVASAIQTLAKAQISVLKVLKWMI
jgi:hypothetical protein